MGDQEVRLNTYLSFYLAEEIFAIEINKIIEVMDVCKIIGIPQTPDFQLGVINLRGDVIPVVDIREILGLSVNEYTLDTKIVILNLRDNDKNFITGIISDSVIEVLEFEHDQIEEMPSIGNHFGEYLKGMVEGDDQHFIMILDIGKVFENIGEKILFEVSR